LISLAALLVLLATAPGPCAALAGAYQSSDGFTALRADVEAGCHVRLRYWSDGGESWEETVEGAAGGETLTLTRRDVLARRGVPYTFTLVPWGRRRYLVPSSNLVGFCNAVNAGEEPTSRFWVLATEGEVSSGLPEVPASARRFLLERPLRGRVLRILRNEEFETVEVDGCRERRRRKTALVRVDVGRRGGALEGMTLFIRNPRRPNVRAILVLRDVGENESNAEAVDQTGRIRPGDGVSSRSRS